MWWVLIYHVVVLDLPRLCEKVWMPSVCPLTGDIYIKAYQEGIQAERLTRVYRQTCVVLRANT